MIRTITQLFKNYFSLLLLVTIGANDASAQLEVPINMPSYIPKGSPSCADDNGNVYFTYINSQRNVEASWFDGLIWRTLPILEIGEGALGVYDCEIFRGELVVCGRFDYSEDSLTRYRNIAKWDGGSWNVMGSTGPPMLNDTGYIGKLVAGNEVLFVQGRFDTSNLYSSSWQKWSDSTWKESGLSKYQDIRYLDLFNKTDTVFYKNTSSQFVYKVQDGVILDSFSTVGSFLAAAGDAVFFGVPSQLNIYKNGSVSVVNDPQIKKLLYFNMEWHKGEYWIHGYVGNNTFKILHGVIDTLTEVASRLTRRSTLTSSGETIFYYETSGWEFGLYSEDASIVKGELYFDEIINCRKDIGDKAFQKIVGVKSGNFSTMSDDEGNFQFLVVPNNKYKVDVDLPKYYSITCNLSDTFTAVKDTVYTMNFALRPNSIVKDVSVALSASTTRHGFPANFKIEVENVGTDSIVNRTIRLELDNGLTKFSSGNSHTKNGNIVEFNINELGLHARKSLSFSATIDTANFERGDTIINRVYVVELDGDTSDNSFTLHSIVTAAFDPNNKICYPEGKVVGPLHEINYTINFQNTGNDTAIRVIVIDTVDTDMPLKYLRVTGTSHPDSYNLSVKNNTLIWTFENIMLPDSHVDYEGSQGYISYKAKITSGFSAPGDSLTNRAHIYFDYQDPVATNVALVVREDSVDNIPDPPTPIGLYIKVYPNPANDKITIVNFDKVDHKIALYDINGRIVRKERKLPIGEIIIDTNELSNGIYFLQYEHGLVAKVLIIK